MSLTTYIILILVCNIFCFIINGPTIYTIAILVVTAMFAARKFGVFITINAILTVECLLMFFSITWRLLFADFHWLPFLGTLLFRAITLLLIYLDGHNNVYVTEERKRVNN